MASTGSILSGAFGLFRKRPGAVGIWIAIFILYSMTVGAWALRGMGVDMEAMRAGQGPDFSLAGYAFGMALIGLAFASVMNCAFYRAVLRPEEGGFAFLRIGMDEVRLFGLYLLVIVACAFLGLILGLFAFFLIAGGTFAGGESGFGALFGFIVACGLMIGGIYVAVRLSLIFPLTFVRRKLSVDEGWALAKGHFWKLFLAYLVIGIIVIILQIFVPTFPGQPGVMAMLAAMREGTPPDMMRAQQAAAMASMTFAGMLPYLVIASIVQGIAGILGNAAAATATRELLAAQGESLDDEANPFAGFIE